MPSPAFVRSLRSAAVPTCALAAALLFTSSAHAAGTSSDFEVSVYPAGYGYDDLRPLPTPLSTGSYYANYSVAGYDGAVPVRFKVLQIRGGVVIGDSSAQSNPDPISILPGDIIREVRRTDGATLGEATFTGQPSITSSVIGQPTFAGTNSPGATSVSVRLERRVRRNQTSSYDGYSIPPRTTNYVETVGFGRLTSIGDSTFAGTFGTPIASGDYITTTQDTNTIVNDVQNSTSFSVTAPVGVIPAKDVVPPKLLRLLFGAKSLPIKSFLSDGLNTFVTTDEASGVTQTLTYQPPVTKTKSKAHKSAIGSAAKKKKKKTKKPTKPTVAPAPVVIASSAGAATQPGETVALNDKPLPVAKKTLATAVKGATLTVTTKITDLAGNVATSTQTYTLTAK